MTDEFKFNDIAGQPATLEINSSDTHCVITWGNITVSDFSGHVGFWTSFNAKPQGNLHGAVLQAALHKHARQMIESEIYQQIKFLQQQTEENT